MCPTTAMTGFWFFSHNARNEMGFNGLIRRTVHLFTLVQVCFVFVMFLVAFVISNIIVFHQMFYFEQTEKIFEVAVSKCSGKVGGKYGNYLQLSSRYDKLCASSQKLLMQLFFHFCHTTLTLNKILQLRHTKQSREQNKYFV